MGTWLGEDSSVLVMEHFEDLYNSERFSLYDVDNNLLASGSLQYVEEYDYVYAYNEHDGIAHKCWYETDGALCIDSFGTFTKVSGDVPGENIGDTEEESEQLPDISGYTGNWKAENEPLYFVISDSCEWAAVNLYGEENGPGYVVADEGFITLCMEDGSDDYYSNIVIAFQPISGYDPYMEQGSATAKPYMVKMLDDFMESMYGDHLIKSIGSDFSDNGDYYSITGYMWLDSSIFQNGPSQPVRGCMEVRYYGPTGYALVAITIAPENRISNYFDICNNMLTTLSYTAGWSTAPKARPAEPAYSGDSGDYGTPYYWYDEDGDIWYWNGYENVFISYGSDGYIDGDTGEYMESNDAGWDYDEYYYDDYDPWSDPGDGWDEWSDPGDYYDDGWGDYFD